MTMITFDFRHKKTPTRKSILSVYSLDIKLFMILYLNNLERVLIMINNI